MKKRGKRQGAVGPKERHLKLLNKYISEDVKDKNIRKIGQNTSKGNLLLFALKDPTRLLILWYLALQKEGVSINQLADDLNTALEDTNQKTLSYKNFHNHIVVLIEMGLVTSEKITKKVRGQPRIVKIKEGVLPIKIKLGENEFPIIDPKDFTFKKGHEEEQAERTKEIERLEKEIKETKKKLAELNKRKK